MRSKDRDDDLFIGDRSTSCQARDDIRQRAPRIATHGLRRGRPRALTASRMMARESSDREQPNVIFELIYLVCGKRPETDFHLRHGRARARRRIYRPPQGEQETPRVKFGPRINRLTPCDGRSVRIQDRVGTTAGLNVERAPRQPSRDCKVRAGEASVH